MIHSTLLDLTQGLLELLFQKSYSFPVKYSEQHESSIVSFMHPNADAFLEQLKSQGGNATYRHVLIHLSPGIYQTETTIKALSTIL